MKRIVKVQLSLGLRPQRVLIYDQSREWSYEGPSYTAIKALLGERVKDFFYAELVNDRIHLLERAPWQTW